ncbi:MAG: LemA family protein [Verrucomicrobiota bacterium]
MPFIPWLGGLLALLALIASLRAARRKRLVNDLPTSKTSGVFIGLVELKGTAESDHPLASFFSAEACVIYEWSVQEHWSRTVTETYTDSKGNTQTRTRHESGWTTVADGREAISFYLRDECGAVQVVPSGATIEPQTIFSETCTPLNPLYYGKGPAGAVANSDFRRQFVEKAILLHAPLYVMGQARERSDVVAAEIAGDKNATMFLISTRTEEQVSRGFGWGHWGWGALGLILAAAGFFAVDQVEHRTSGVAVYFFAAGAFLLAWLAGWIWMAFNSLIDLRQRVRQGWAQVDVQLKRRHDLIPNLVQAVQGLRDYERNLQMELATLRGQLGATPPGKSGDDYEAVGKVLMAVAEQYPDLKSQESFANLQKNLIDTEQRIALARGYFNEIATFYNTRLEVVPDRFIALLGAMKPQSLMAANDFERAPIEVDFQEAEGVNTTSNQKSERL